MPEYGKKTVAELQEILKGRSLPHTGKKADLVARLNEADKSIEAKPGTKVSQHHMALLTHLAAFSSFVAYNSPNLSG